MQHKLKYKLYDKDYKASTTEKDMLIFLSEYNMTKNAMLTARK